MGNDGDLVVAPLISFVYDNPLLSICGVLAPFRLFNQLLAEGTAGGGMSPGCAWEPFVVSLQEYDELVREIELSDPSVLPGEPRFHHLKIGVDKEFDEVSDHLTWMMLVSEKYRERFHRRIRELETRNRS